MALQLVPAGERVTSYLEKDYLLLRVSCLKLEINEVRCYEAQIEESEKGWQPPGVEPRTPLA